MAVLWTSVFVLLSAINLHFFWTAQHLASPSMNNTSLQYNFGTNDGQIVSKPEARTMDFGYSAPPSTSDVRFLSTMSQFASSLSSFMFPADPEKVNALGASKFSLVTVNPVELPGHSTVPASPWTVADDVQYCLIARRYIRFYLDIWYWIDLALWGIAPFITIIRFGLATFSCFAPYFHLFFILHTS